jgi:hypothetical protein
VKRRQRTHAASGGASEALPHEVGARPSRSEPKLNTHALYPSRSELRGITFKNKKLRETRKVQSASFGILTQIIFLIFKHFNKNKLKIDIPVRSLPRSAD